MNALSLYLNSRIGRQTQWPICAPYKVNYFSKEKTFNIVIQLHLIQAIVERQLYPVFWIVHRTKKNCIIDKCFFFCTSLFLTEREKIKVCSCVPFVFLLRIFTAESVKKVTLSFSFHIISFRYSVRFRAHIFFSDKIQSIC